MSNIRNPKIIKRLRRHKRVRSVVSGSENRPRLCVFRANKHIYAQLIDDVSGKTLAAASSLEIKVKDKKTNVAMEVGKLVASKAVSKKVVDIVFDRGGFAYHGRVKALAEGAREGGLKF